MPDAEIVNGHLTGGTVDIEVSQESAFGQVDNQEGAHESHFADDVLDPGLVFHVENPDEREEEVAADEVDDAEDADVDERPTEIVRSEHR